MNKSIINVAIPLLAWLTSSVYSQNLSASHVIAPSAVWDASPDVVGQLYSECADLWGSPELVNCVSSIMRKNAASFQAIEFSKQLGGKGFLTSFRETGRVDIGDVHYFVRGMEPGGLVFLNGETPIVDVEGPCCPAAKFLDDVGDSCNCPEGVDTARRDWHPSFHSAGSLPDGGQRFVVRYEGRTCHACAVETWIYDGYDFSPKGKFVGARFLYERAASKERAPVRQKAKNQAAPKKPPVAERVAVARNDLLTAAKEYKASLEKLLPFEEDERKRAAEEVDLRKLLVAEGVTMEARDLEESKRKLASAEAKIKETRRQLVEADELIEDAMKPTALEPGGRTKRQVKRSKARRPTQKLHPGVKVVKYPRITA
jgi:hypothetical protein